MKDYYEILGVSRDASKADIHNIYRKLAHIYHPDIGGNERKFKEINEAHGILSDDKKRVEYDARFNQSSQNYQPSPKSGGTSVTEEFINKHFHIKK